MTDSKLGQIGDFSKKIGSSIQKSVDATKKVAKQQIGIEQGSEKDQTKTVQQSIQTGDQKDQSEEIVKALYGKTDPKLQTPQTQAAKAIAQKNPQKSPEEIQKMTSLRMELHKNTYYDPTFNPQKEQEEKPAERVERLDEEEKKKRWEFAQKEEKKKPIAVERANKTEKFRGTSG